LGEKARGASADFIKSLYFDMNGNGQQGKKDRAPTLKWVLSVFLNARYLF
jgi:hypothetical protein